MPRLITTILLIGGGWFVFSRYQIAGLDEIHLRPKSSAIGEADEGSAETPLFGFTPTAATPDAATTPKAGAATIDRDRPLRVGLFHLDRLDRHAADDLESFPRAARLIAAFDVVAIQGIKPGSEPLLEELVTIASPAGHRHVVFGPRAGQQRLAFVYDTRRLALDHQQLYTISDPDDLLLTDPLVGWFQATGQPPGEAWTFSLVNVPIERPLDPELLPQIYHAVRHDRRGEDDCLLAVSVARKNDVPPGPLTAGTLHSVLRDQPTTVRADRQLDNLFFGFDTEAEFVGDSGTIDFLRDDNLTVESAEQIATHNPVWGQFLPREQVAQ